MNPEEILRQLFGSDSWGWFGSGRKEWDRVTRPGRQMSTVPTKHYAHESKVKRTMARDSRRINRK